MDDSLDTWFKREILSHEEALLGYLTRTWPRRQEIHDLRQEIYIRVFEGAAKSRPHSPKSFLFATARHLMTDRIRRERVVSIEAVGDLENLNVLIDEISPEQRVGARQELKRLAQAFDLLPQRAREVLWMRRVQEMPQREVAIFLGIDEKTVEKHLSKAGRLLAEYLLGGESLTAEPASSHAIAKSGEEHEQG